MLKDSSNSSLTQDSSHLDEKADGLPWGPTTAIWYSVLLYVAAQIGVALAISVTLFAFGWDAKKISTWLSDNTFAQFLYIALAEVITIGGVVWFVRRRGVKMRVIGWNKPQLRYVGYAIAGLAVYFAGYLLLASIVSALIPSLNLNQEQDIGFKTVGSNMDMLLTFVSLVILPPLAEETVFRGFLYTGLRRRFPFWAATLVTSVLFAIPHLQFGNGAPLLWVAALDTFILSLVLCYVREHTASLWPGIFIHALKNGIAFVALFLIT